MANLVLKSEGVGVDIADISLSGDFTIEFSIYLDPSDPVTGADTAFSGPGASFDFQNGIPRLAVGGATLVAGTQAVQTDAWTNVAIVREGGSVALVLDGEYVALEDWTGTLTIGELAAGLNGRLDGVRVWDVARTGTEINEGLSGQVDIDGGVPAGLIRYYRFDDDAAHIVDATGNAETGHDLHLPAGVEIIEDGTAPAAVAPDAAGFIDTTVVSGLVLATDMAFLPDGRMLVTQKNGVVTLIEDPTQINGPTSTYLDLTDQTLSQVEAGLLSLVVDPNFADNGYVYLFYTNSDVNQTTVSRFTHVEGAGGTASYLDPATETVLWRETDVFSDGHHQGSAMGIAYEPTGPDDPSPYKLYIGTGDEFEGANSQDLTHDDGKIHRINLTDGSIPTDNPYYDAAVAATYTPWVNTSTAISTNAPNLALDAEGVMTTIYSYGLRNPFRGYYDQESGTFWVGDVGGNNNMSWEDVHVARPGADHGWPSEEGYHGDPNDPGSPVHSYNHLNGPGVNQTGVFGGSGASISGGLIYRGEQFPEEFQDGYFYGDWVRKWIRYLEVDWSTGEPVVVSDEHFANTTGQVLTFEEGPDGSLYYITTFQTGAISNFTGTVNRLVYDTSNRAPTGEGIVLDPGEETSTTVPHTVTFEADVSDPDGDALSYQWSFGDGVDLDGDGKGDTATSTEAAPSWTYTEAGTYTVELIVTDANGAAKVFEPKLIQVGNAPVVTINSPADGLTFRAGDTLTLTGDVTDIEDGTVAEVFWSAQFFHNDHVHPQLPPTPDQPGGLTLEVPTIGHDYFDDTGFFIYLTATDSDGLTTSQRVFVAPEESVTTYDVPDVTGVGITIDGVFFGSDIAYDNVINFQHTLAAPESYVDNGILFEFSHWSDDPSITTATRTFVVPETDTTVAPVYENSGIVSQSLKVEPTGAEPVPPLTLGQGGADFTIEGWVQMTAGESVSKVDGLFLGTDEDGKPVDLNFHSGEAHLFSRGLRTDVVTGTQTLQAGEWHHVAVTREGGVTRLYVDGALDATSGIAWDKAITVTSLGGSIGGGSASLDGALDEIRMWDVARSGAEIAANHDRLVDPGTPGLARYYRVDGTGEDAVGSADLDVSGDTFLQGAPLILGDVNAPPVAVDDTVALPAGFDPVAMHLYILDNDTDSDGQIDTRAVEVVSQTAHGTIEIIDTVAELDARGLSEAHFGHAEYTLTDPGYEGADSFTYRVQDDDGAWSNVATVSIMVGNPAPTAADDSVVLAQGFDPMASHLHILMNDSDPNGTLNRQMVEIVSGPTHGSVEIIDTPQELADRGKDESHYGHAEYTPTDPSYTGFDSFTYRVQDDGGAWSNVATVTIEVVGDPRPVATDDGFVRTVGFDPVAERLDVLANDTDDSAIDATSVEILSGPANGTVEVIDTAQELADLGLTADAYGDVIFTPTDPAFEGTDGFTYRVQDDVGGWSDPATVAVTVQAEPPQADGQALALVQSASLTIPAITLGQGGADFAIEAWIRMEDGAPVSKVDGLFFARDDANKPIDLNFHNGIPHLYSRGLRTDVVKGSTAVEAGTWTHVALSREGGIVSLYLDGALEATGATAWTSEITVTRVGGSIASGSAGLQGAVDDVRFWSTARSAADIAANTGAPVDPGTAGLVRAYGFDGDLADATGGSADPAMPAGAGFVDGATGAGSGGTGGTGGTNLAPTGSGIVLDPGEDAGTPPHVVTFEADATDPEGTALSYAWDFGDGTTGAGAAPSHQYVSAGVYSAVLTVTDADGASTTFDAVDITVSATGGGGNAAPVAGADAATTDVDAPVLVDVLANDTDADGSIAAATVDIVSGPANGTVEVLDTLAELTARGLDATAMGQIEYVPTTGFAGPDTFVYRVQDDAGDWSNDATVSVDVQAPPPPPSGGPTGGAMELDARGDALDIADVVLTGDFTVEAWVQFDPAGFVNKYDALFGAGTFDSTPGDDDATDGVFGNDFNFHKSQLNFYASESAGNSIAFDAFALEEGVWTHVALTRSGNVYTGYVDGVASDPDTFDFVGDVVVDSLGGGMNGTRVLDGRMDDVRLWATARSQAEIAAGMDGVDPTSADLLRYYTFEDADYVIDATGAGEGIGDLAWADVDAIRAESGMPFA